MQPIAPGRVSRAVPGAVRCQSVPNVMYCVNETAAGRSGATEKDKDSMGSTAQLNQFLADVEKRAYSMALMAVKNPDDALDIVQDVMLTLAQKYAHKPADQWRPLFYRMLKNRITDFHRGGVLRRKLFAWRSAGQSEEEYADPIESAIGPEQQQPDKMQSNETLRQRISAAVSALPERQRQAFVLRAWEGMDVAETASAMGCSSGSVKTHFSRAVRALRDVLGDLKL